MASGKMSKVVACGYASLEACRALDLACNVTQGSNVTTYSISDVSGVLDVDASDCEYCWTNAANDVLANDVQKNALVMKNSIDTLVTSECYDNIIFTRSCLSEKAAYMANCTTSCSTYESISQDKEMFTVWITAIVLIVIAVVIIASLCYRFREKIARRCSWSRGFYTTVKMTVNPRAHDVEAAHM